MQNLCDLGANVLTGCRSDGSFRMSVDGQPIGQGAGISTFCEDTVVDVNSCVKVDKDMPLDLSNVALVCPSCNRPTRVGYRLDDAGKHRVCKKCGKDL